MAVVKKTLITIEPGDVLKVVIRCTKCGGEIVYPTDSQSEFRSCPLCSAPWDRKDDESQREHTIELFNTLRYFWSDEFKRRRREGKIPWDITLVLPSDSD